MRTEQESAVIPGVQLMLLERLALDDALQPRAHMDFALITEYAEQMRAGDQFPPLVAYLDSDGTCWLSQGWHRYGAAREAGIEALQVDLRLGSYDDALLDSLASNKDHGLRRSNADKARAVTTLLLHPTYGHDGTAGWSDRDRADFLGVGHVMVSRYHQQLFPPAHPVLLEHDRPMPPQPPITKTVERNGTQYELTIPSIGPRPAPEPAPTLSEMMTRAGADDDPRIKRARYAKTWSAFVSRWYDGVLTVYQDLDVIVAGADGRSRGDMDTFADELRSFAARLSHLLDEHRTLRAIDGGSHG